MSRYIFITGGVVSSLGKGLMAAALGALLQARGYRVRLRKLDPYLNIDPGTMSPYQHGEVYVTDDGAETDLDLGHYERFTGVPGKSSDNVTSGCIYSNILDRERRGDFLGGTVQVIPHVTGAIKDFVKADNLGEDFVLCEIGGTVGDIESLPFLEAIRQIGNDLPNKALFIHVTLVPFIRAAGELKTKPTQHSVKELRSIGIQPHVLVCRCEQKLEPTERSKIAQFCNVPFEAVIPALDAKSIYDVPVQYHEAGLDKQILKAFHITDAALPNLSNWEEISDRLHHPEGQITIAIIGKYTGLKDAYKSLNEALTHGGIANKVQVNINWVNAEDLENQADISQYLESADGLLIPGGFGTRGAEGKIAAAHYARTHNIPYFGICYGMQMAVIEAARNLAGIGNANSSEFGPCDNPVIGLLTEWEHNGNIKTRSENSNMGGTLRLGSYPAILKEGSKISKIYGNTRIEERHRHRYEVNITYRKQLEDAGLRFSGMSPDGRLPETIEYPDHPWFVAVQFHPELKSRPFEPHPLFVDFIAAALAQNRLV